MYQYVYHASCSLPMDRISTATGHDDRHGRRLGWTGKIELPCLASLSRPVGHGGTLSEALTPASLRFSMGGKQERVIGLYRRTYLFMCIYINVSLPTSSTRGPGYGTY